MVLGPSSRETPNIKFYETEDNQTEIVPFAPSSHVFIRSKLGTEKYEVPGHDFDFILPHMAMIILSITYKISCSYNS